MSDQDSTSSVKMVRSKRQKKVIDLGKRIVKELNISEHDTSAAWMAHHLAELISQVETATKGKEKEECGERCARFIMDLWERSLPDRCLPTGRIREVIAVLERMYQPYQYPAGFRDNAGKASSPWLEFARVTSDCERRASTIAFIVGLLEADIESEHLWIEDHNQFVDADEARLISMLQEFVNRNWLYEKLAAMSEEKDPTMPSKKQTAEAALVEMQSLVDRQIEALKELKQKLSD